jgi:hypothetical protein
MSNDLALAFRYAPNEGRNEHPPCHLFLPSSTPTITTIITTTTTSPKKQACLPAPVNGNNNNNNTTTNTNNTTTTTMPPCDPNKMPEFKLVDGWNVAVSGPVYNPAVAATEENWTAAAAEYIYTPVKKPAPSSEDTGAPESKAPSTATAEKDRSGAAGNRYVYT